uniref:Uncharacterized protein n=1 Tax=Chromera velia CCMP2878 TaxID=1169474 RepID=A0A0G4HEN0_9ALVE|eukprot:Cvel_26639.t1-p1 / transcript=Cvel_26639.t1 / gene=Cvel_26639 / organism=Chromera_velia_CCMP2878 / gene_product=Erythronolide synthase, modules 3 and 4, putative / transcript_product=Erythronolide synthase, modules 3 and 4, putative / location=Cvel_scaffold3202:8670-19054(+) / protein_length=2832 / sequence_SO=supercontig / SO=protein_coding / is_pseudo=false
MSDLHTLWRKYGSSPFAKRLRLLAAAKAEEPALSCLDAEASITSTISYSDFYSRVTRLAVALRDVLGLKKGDRAILCYPPGVDFLTAFYACLLTGIISVPVYPPEPRKAGTDLPRFCEIASTAGVEVCLTNATYRRVVTLLSTFNRDRRWGGLKWAATPNMISGSACDGVDVRGFEFPELSQSDVCFLQFTSGSTSSPKGVMVTHGSLLHNIHEIVQILGLDSSLDDPNTHENTQNYPMKEMDVFFQKREEICRRVRGHGLRLFSWLPVYHDMGLISKVVAPIFFGLHALLMSPLDFIRKPYSWLAGLSKHKAFICGAPNFAFDLVAAKTPDAVVEKLDLSHVAGYVCGAEPIREGTLRRFVERFGAAGVKPWMIIPAYGLAENTLIVTGRPSQFAEPRVLWVDAAALREKRKVKALHDGPLFGKSGTQKGKGTKEDERTRLTHAGALPLVSSGKAFPGVTVRIVHPESLREEREGAVGEVWVQSDSTASGYFAAPEKTEECFGRSCLLLDGTHSAPAFLRTGDSGFLWGGELFIVGRIKDMIILRGRNFYPQDIEEVVEECPSIRKSCSACFALDLGEEGGECVGVAAEVRDKPSQHGGGSLTVGGFVSWLKHTFDGSQEKKEKNDSYASIRKQIVAAVARKVGIPVHRVWLLPPRSLPKTSSGKVQRSLARQRLLAKEIPGVLFDSESAPESGVDFDEMKCDREAVSASRSSRCLPSLPSTALPGSSELLDTEEPEASPPMGDQAAREEIRGGEAGAEEVKLQRAVSTRAVDLRREQITAAVTSSAQQILCSAKSRVGESDSDTQPSPEPVSVDFNVPLYEYGLDSLAAVEFAEDLSIRLSMHLEPTLLFNYPTLRDVVDFLDEGEGNSSAKPSAPDPSEEVFSPSPSINGISDPAVLGSTQWTGEESGLAVVGVACRLPGGSSSLERYWEMMMRGTDCTSEVPLNRWNNEAVYDPDPDVEGTLYVREAAFIEGIELFDNAFFSISAAEAKYMDPQQRHMLEVAYEAFFHGGFSRESLLGSLTGVFIGCCSPDWHSVSLKGKSNALSSTGLAQSLLSNRISFALGLKGPSLTVDTACSSSLVAMDAAVDKVRRGVCSRAVVGGVNLLISPLLFIGFTKARMLSPDARCKTFDESANGYARGEGAGAVVLQRVADARAQKKAVFAVVRGAAVNHVGRAASLTAPNGPSQQEAIRCALRDGGVNAADVCFVEAHGTGTALGDPIEMGALKAVYGEGRGEENPLVIGAVKTNFGHLEGAAGIAGFIKLVLVLQHRSAPPNLHLKQLNPHLDIEGFPVVFPTEAVALGGMGGASGTSSLRHRKLIGGVSSFGFGGANAHVVVEEGDRPLSVPNQTEAQDPKDLENRVRQACKAAFVFTGQGSQFVGMCGGLYEHEEVFRSVFDRCESVLKEKGLLDVSVRALLFPSTKADEKVAAARIDETRFAQVALFVVEVCLLELWRSKGVCPDVVMGHSLGEYAAAVACGVMTLEEGLTLVVRRAQVMQETPARDGVMAACRVSEEEVVRAVEALRETSRQAGAEVCESIDTVTVAAVNGPKSVVVAGARGGVEAVLSHLGQTGRAKLLTVSHAFHSPFMRPARKAFAPVLSEMNLSEPCNGMQMVSTVTGAPVRVGEVSSPEHWLSQIERPVRFADAMRGCVEELGCSVIVEVGPQPVLINMGRSCVSSSQEGVTWIASCHRSAKDSETFGNALKQVMEKKASVADSSTGDCETLVAVKWQHRAFPFAPLSHPLVGRLREEGEGGRVFETALRRDVHELMDDHHVMGRVVVPAAAFVDMMAACVYESQQRDERPSHGLQSGGRDWFSGSALPDHAGTPVCLEGIEFERPLILPPSRGTDREPRTLAVSLGRDGKLLLCSRMGLPGTVATAGIALRGSEGGEEGSEWEVHARCSFQEGFVAVEREREDLSSLHSAFEEEMKFDAAESYAVASRMGLSYGRRFQTVTRLWRSEKMPGEVLASLSLSPDDAKVSPAFCVHPALLDGAFQAAAAVRESKGRKGLVLVPVGIRRLTMGRWEDSEIPTLQSTAWAHLQNAQLSDKAGSFDVTLFAPCGRVVADLQGVELRPIDLSRPASIPQELLWEAQWRADERGEMHLVDAEAEGVESEARLFLGAPAEDADEIARLHPSSKVLAFGEVPEGAKLVKLLSSRKWEEVLFLTPLCAVDVCSSADFGAAVVWEGTQLLQAVSSQEWPKEAPRPRVRFVTAGCQRVNDLRSELQEIRDAPPVHAGVLGLVRAAAIDLQSSRVQVGSADVDISRGVPAAVAELVRLTESESVTKQQRQSRFETEVAVRGGQLLVPRLAKSSVACRGPLELHLAERGALSNLRARPQLVSEVREVALEEDRVEVRVRSVGLNFRDVLNVMGLYPGDPGPPGGDFAGTVTRVGSGVTRVRVGEDVFGVSAGSLRTFSVTSEHLVSKKPRGLTFEQASALPVVASTVEYALRDLAKVKKGDRVLIHAAAGGVGLMSVHFCQSVGAVVYATVGSSEKADFVKRQGVEFVSSSRDPPRFEFEMGSFLQGAKLDVVLNSLSGEFIDASVRLLGEGGRFTEIGKREIWSHEKMAETRPDVQYETIAIDSKMQEAPEWFAGMLDRIKQQVERGQLPVLPVAVFDVRSSDPERDGVGAFRFLQRAGHIGKVVVCFPSSIETSERAAVSDSNGPSGLSLPAGGCTYIVTGGLGGLGLVVANWLLDEGAKRIVLVSRRSVPDAETAKRSEMLRLQRAAAEGTVEVEVRACDVSSAGSCARLLQREAAGGSRLGIIHAAGVLADAQVKDQTEESVRRVFAPKVSRVTSERKVKVFLSLRVLVLTFVSVVCEQEFLWLLL